MKTTGNNEKDGRDGSASGKNVDPLTRDQVLRLSSQTIRMLHKRVSGKRFKVQNGDSARLSHVRALAQLACSCTAISSRIRRSRTLKNGSRNWKKQKNRGKNDARGTEKAG